MTATAARGEPSFAARLLFGACFAGFLGGTALLYFWGPWQFPVTVSRTPLVLFLVAVHSAFVAGYVLGIRGVPVSASLPGGVERVVLAGAALELVLLFPTSALNTGSWIPRPWLAAGDLAAAYTASLQLREQATPYVNYIRMISSPLLATTVPLAIFYWAQLRAFTRVLVIGSVVGSVALFVAMGANAGLAQWLALFPWLLAASFLAGVHRLTRRGWLYAASILGLSGVLFAGFFAATMVARAGSYARAGFIPGINARLHTATRPAEPLAAARIGFAGLSAYLSQGYHAVYLGLQEPFVPCMGVGNSVFLQRQAARVTGDTWMLECPYPVRLEPRGWRATTYWASIYPWIASDVTFAGAVLVLGVIGWLAGRVWLDAIGGRNPLAVALLGQVIILLAYVPAHNKLMHSGEGVFGFFGLLAAWSATRVRWHG